MLTSTPLFIGGLPGGMEMAVVLLIAILLFGANKIPKLARSSGEAIGEFQKGREEVEQELQEIKSESAPDASADTTADTTSDTTTDATSSADDTATN